jgi:hypothetical protein
VGRNHASLLRASKLTVEAKFPKTGGDEYGWSAANIGHGMLLEQSRWPMANPTVLEAVVERARDQSGGSLCRDVDDLRLQ